MKVNPKVLRKVMPGDILFASCSQEEFGHIVSINHDEKTCDIIVHDVSDILPMGEYIDLFYEPDVPCSVKVSNLKISRLYDGEPYKIGDTNFTGLYICFDTPWDGCGRCVAHFNLMRK